MPDHLPKPSAQSDEAARKRASSFLGRVIQKRYRIDEVIAMGGMGAVYRGEHMHMRRRIAIKILHPDAEQLPELVKRFEREAIAGAHIQHVNVASAIDFGEIEDGSYFLVLEYVRGVTLHEIIRRGPLPVGRAVHIARQIAAALDAVHAMDIVHRDLKPRNVMVVEAQGDLVKLIDFGLAKVSMDRLSAVTAAETERAERVSSMPDSNRLTGIGVLFGTIAYLSPEAALGMDMVDARSDLYALGLMLYEMLAGKHPFLAQDPFELFNQQRNQRPAPIGEHSPGVEVPAELEAVVQRLLEKQPHMRYGTGGEVVAALDEACAAAGIVTIPSGGAAAFKSPSSRPPPPMEEKGAEPGEQAAVETAAEPPAPAAEVEVEPEPSKAEPATAPPEDDAHSEAEASKTKSKKSKSKKSKSKKSARSIKVEAAPSFEHQPAAESIDENSRMALPPEPEGPAEPVAPAGKPGRRRVGMYLALAAIAGVIIFVLMSRSSPPPEPEPLPAGPPRTASAPPSAAPAPSGDTPPPQPPASAAPTAAPDATSSAVAPAEPAPDLAGREALQNAVKAKLWLAAVDALIGIAERDPTALRDRAVARSARDVAVAVAQQGGDSADRIFEALSQRFGSAGIDVLYEIIQTRGRSTPAVRATELLRTPEVAARGSPAARIAFELRDAPCDKKLELLDRAVSDGDERALRVLDQVVRPCFKQSRPVDEATRKLRDRLKGG